MKNLKDRVRKGDLLIGTLLTLPAPEIAEIMAMKGFDWLFIDMEHGALDIRDCQSMIQAVASRSSCLVRIPELTESSIKKALDVGADGVIVPRVNTVEEAMMAVNFSKYPPEGDRGVGASRAQGYGLNFKDYVETFNERGVVVIQIEHIKGVEHIDEIVKVEGVDVVFIGPYDLSASMGLTGQLDHPSVLEAIERVEEACAKEQMALGYFGTTPEAVSSSIEKGYQLVACGIDTGFLIEGASKVVDALK